MLQYVFIYFLREVPRFFRSCSDTPSAATQVRVFFWGVGMPGFPVFLLPDSRLSVLFFARSHEAASPVRRLLDEFLPDIINTVLSRKHSPSRPYRTKKFCNIATQILIFFHLTQTFYWHETTSKTSLKFSWNVVRLRIPCYTFIALLLAYEISVDVIAISGSFSVVPLWLSCAFIDFFQFRKPRL
jgi:hypothetical protein